MGSWIIFIFNSFVHRFCIINIQNVLDFYLESDYLVQSHGDQKAQLAQHLFLGPMGPSGPRVFTPQNQMDPENLFSPVNSTSAYHKRHEELWGCLNSEVHIFL